MFNMIINIGLVIMKSLKPFQFEGSHNYNYVFLINFIFFMVVSSSAGGSVCDDMVIGGFGIESTIFRIVLICSF